MKTYYQSNKCNSEWLEGCSQNTSRIQMCKPSYMSVLKIRDTKKLGSWCFRECGVFGKAVMEAAFPAGCMTPGSDKVSGKGERIHFQKCFKAFKMTTHHMLLSTQKTFFSPSCSLLRVNIICMLHTVITIPNFTAIWLPVFFIPLLYPLFSTATIDIKKWQKWKIRYHSD